MLKPLPNFTMRIAFTSVWFTPRCWFHHISFFSPITFTVLAFWKKAKVLSLVSIFRTVARCQCLSPTHIPHTTASHTAPKTFLRTHKLTLQLRLLPVFTLTHLFLSEVSKDGRVMYRATEAQADPLLGGAQKPWYQRLRGAQRSHLPCLPVSSQASSHTQGLLTLTQIGPGLSTSATSLLFLTRTRQGSTSHPSHRPGGPAARLTLSPPPKLLLKSNSFYCNTYLKL